MRLVAACLALACMVGCGGGTQSWWPLRVGSVRSFSLVRGATTIVADWKVEREAPVGAQSGFQLSSPVGTSLLAWDGNRLVASQLAGTRYEPPIPILVEGEATWKGTVAAGGKSAPGTAVVVGKAGKSRHPVFGVRTLEVVATIRSEGQARVVETTYAHRVGLVTQSHRTDDTLDYRLTILGSR